MTIVPGVTALGSCASLAGAPLGHDFCAISLSDLLTPWEVIARRLEAAAAAGLRDRALQPGEHPAPPARSPRPTRSCRATGPARRRPRW